MTAIKFLERELAAAKRREVTAQDSMDWYGRKLDRHRTDAESKAWLRWLDRRDKAQVDQRFIASLLRKARRTR